MSGDCRRTLPVVLAIVAAALGWLTTASARADGRVALDELRVERKADPIGIDVDQPRFSWVIESDRRGTEQRSYRVRVTAAGALGQGRLG